jgi:GNAT superfamily N-acetyltransferase
MHETAHYLVPEVLRNGTPILIRAISPDDKQRLVRHFQGLSSQSVYYRFFGLKHSLSDDDLRQLTELDFVNHVGLAATMEGDEGELFIGVGRYIRTEGHTCAEIAFAVLDEYQSHGIGTLLLKHLARIAQMNRITRFSADVLGSNHLMLEVFSNSGFRKNESYESGVVRQSLEI